MSDVQGHILIVDDDVDMLVASQMLLKPHFEQVDTTADPAEIPDRLRRIRTDVVLLDMNFSRGATSGAEGFRWLDFIQQTYPTAVVIIITAHGGVDVAVEAMKRGATDFVSKPWDNERLVATVKSGLQLALSRRETETLKQKNRALLSQGAPSGTMLLGVSEAMRNIYALMMRAAPTDANVLILGENGTGKDLVAREIHRASLRVEKPFLAVDLGAVSETLLESELFGHRKGAFTDAKSDRLGRFQAADGGTLFLDEIGNLPLHLQPKLLAALERRQVTPVGATTPQDIDVRVISATNLSPEHLADGQIFRTDLLYRLNTIEIHVPPLRERPEDIPELATHFCAMYAKKYGRENLSLTPSAIRALQNYSWPGNVRALRHAIERAVILASSDRIGGEEFLLDGHSTRTKEVDPVAPATDSSLNLAELERSAIERALNKHGWNISHAANELGLTRASLYRRMGRHGL